MFNVISMYRMLQTSWTLAKCLFDSRSLSRFLCTREFYVFSPCPSCILSPHTILLILCLAIVFPFAFSPHLPTHFYFLFARIFFPIKICCYTKTYLYIEILFLNISAMMEFIFYLTFPDFILRLGIVIDRQLECVCVCVYWYNMYSVHTNGLNLKLWIVFFLTWSIIVLYCIIVLFFLKKEKKLFSIIASDKKEKMKWVPTLSAGP